MAEEKEIKETKEKKDTPKKDASSTDKKEAPKKKPVKAPPKKPKAEENKKEVKKSPPKKEEKKESPKEEKKGGPAPKPKKEVKKVKEVEKKVIITEEEEEDEAPEKEEIEIVEEEGEYRVKIKPKLGKGLKRELQIRRTIKRRTPHFKQQEWFRYKRINESWRKPRGMHSKMRKHKGYRPNVVSIGYGGPSKVRNLHPSGFKEIMVYNPKDLENINPKVQAARVGHSVGTRKRIDI